MRDDGDAGKNYPGYTIPDELTTARSAGYKSGTIAMANTGQPDSGAAQFFINTGDNTEFFAPAYAVFGQVTSGLDIAKMIESKDEIVTIIITTAP